MIGDGCDAKHYCLAEDEPSFITINSERKKRKERRNRHREELTKTCVQAYDLF